MNGQWKIISTTTGLTNGNCISKSPLLYSIHYDAILFSFFFLSFFNKAGEELNEGG